ncbi:MAG: Gfo/Idh/MocA family oxidoreductase [Gaiella sp.]|nr:Gfo/Idh/MocA family oxidoreductase [Gaiella sp.]
MRSYRLGIVGAGFITQTAHVPSVNLLGDVEVVAVADPVPESAQRAARACRAAHVYAAGEELLERHGDELDGVIVATPRGTHAEACIPFVERGVPVLLEKPLDATHEGARRIVEAQERTGTVVVVGYHNRFDPAFAAAEHLVRERELGRLRHVSIRSFGGAWKAGAAPPGTLSTADAPRVLEPPRAESRDRREHPAEVEWLEGWIHEVNLAQALLGDVRDVAFASSAMPRLAVVDYEGGRALFEVGLISPPGFPFQCRLTLHCERGRMELELAPPLLSRARSVLEVVTHESATFPSLDFRESFVDELSHFLRCVDGAETPRTTVQEAMRDVELCLAIAGRSEAPVP